MPVNINKKRSQSQLQRKTTDREPRQPMTTHRYEIKIKPSVCYTDRNVSATGCRFAKIFTILFEILNPLPDDKF